jgi:hypothetical protein
VLNSIGREVFIGVLGAVTDLIKSITHQVLACWPSHMAGRPSREATTISRTRIPFHCLLESVTGGCKVGLASRPATHWAHMSVAFARYFLVSGVFPE